MRVVLVNIMIYLICFLFVVNDFLLMGKGFFVRVLLEKKSFFMFIFNGEN